MTALTRWVLAHKKIVAGFWLVLTLVGFAFSGKASESFDQKFSVPDREGWATQEQIAKTFGGGGENFALLPVVTLPEGTTVDSQGIRDELATIDEKAQKALPDARIASFATTGDKAFVSDDGRTAFAIIYPKVPDTQFGEDPISVAKLRAALKGAEVGG